MMCGDLSVVMYSVLVEHGWAEYPCVGVLLPLSC